MSNPGADVPRHVGIIMDGNGRWAEARGLPRTEGHRRGLETAKLIVTAAEGIGIEVLSLYAFSTENWRRTVDEVGFLMGLIKRHLASELDFYRENQVRVVHSGDARGLPPDVAEEIRRVSADTAGFTRLTVNLAINYGGRDEIARAVRALIAKEGGDALSPESISRALDHPELPDPDLVIRTGGEMRMSNFLLWEAAYAELAFSRKLWPDFMPGDLEEAVDDFKGRDRRFGGVK